MDGQGARECARLLTRLRQAEETLFRRENALGRVEEAVRVIQGEISAAESTLQRIVDQIRANVHTGTSCALGDKRDCVGLAIGLANEQAQQQSKLRRLNDKLLDKTIDRDGLRAELDLDRIDVQRVLAAMNANGC